MNYKIVIPSYNRVSQIQTKTLNLLLKHNIPQTIIYIFVHTDCYNEYKNIIGAKYQNINIIESKNNIKDSRNYINNYFNNNDKIVEIDDDIDDLINLNLDKPLENLNEFIEESFNMCGNGLWGVSAINNKFFSSMKDKFGLQSIVATFCGYTIDKEIKLTLDVMEDYERAIKYFLKKKSIFKRSWVGIKTKYWTNKGGIQTCFNFEERKIIQNNCSDILATSYPHLVYQRTRKNGLKDIRYKKNINI
tara:strand:- start:256 stop:996 length:741 start_codon:yes stop_codon:yes gene_type:complete